MMRCNIKYVQVPSTFKGSYALVGILVKYLYEFRIVHTASFRCFVPTYYCVHISSKLQLDYEILYDYSYFML